MNQNNNIIPASEIVGETFFVDYNGVNVLPPILNQRDYFGPNPPRNPDEGQCLAVSSVELMQTKLNFGSVVRGEPAPPVLSVQHLVDVMTPKPPGYPQSLFTYLQSQGVVTDADYRNAPIQNDGTKNLEGLWRCRIGGCREYYCGPTTVLQRHRREEAMAELASSGPVIGELSVTSELLEYKTGILTGNNFVINRETGRVHSHAAMIVGYGLTNSGQYYWIMRNNWGGDFGDNGYFRITMDLVSNVYSFQ